MKKQIGVLISIFLTVSALTAYAGAFNSEKDIAVVSLTKEQVKAAFTGEALQWREAFQ